MRKIVRLSREKAIGLEPSIPVNFDTASTSCSTSHDQTPQITITDATAVDFVGSNGTAAADIVPLAVLPPVVCMTPEAASSNPEVPAVKPKEEDGMKEEDKKFVDDVLALMRRETTFTGEVRLMESVLRINNDAVLNWYEQLVILVKRISILTCIFWCWYWYTRLQYKHVNSCQAQFYPFYLNAVCQPNFAWPHSLIT